MTEGFLSAFFAGSLAGHVKRRVKGVKVFGVKLFLNASESFTESLKMNHFSCTEKTDRIRNFRDIPYYTKNIIISGAGFLLWGDLVSTTYTKI